MTVAEGLQKGDRIAINLPDEMTDGAKVQPILKKVAFGFQLASCPGSRSDVRPLLHGSRPRAVRNDEECCA